MLANFYIKNINWFVSGLCPYITVSLFVIFYGGFLAYPALIPRRLGHKRGSVVSRFKFINARNTLYS